jgi:hypothetical protein
MNQPELLLRVRTDRVCAFGETGNDWPGPHHCAQCAASVAERCREFRAAVARGEYDTEGYTPAERKAQLKRLKERTNG